MAEEEEAKKERSRVFLDVALGGLPVGRVVIELHDERVPRTAGNFRALCTGEAGAPLHYKGSIFHRVVRDFMIQGGDFEKANGTGGESVYGGTFDDESFDRKHDRPFLLSMANRGPNTNGSQFFITTQPAPHLDDVHVVFGHVVSGQPLIKQLEALPVDRNSRPLQDAQITNCGQLVKLTKAKKAKPVKSKASSASDGEESDDSDADEKKKKKKDKKKSRKTKKEEGFSSGSENDEEDHSKGSDQDEAEHPLAQVSRIDPKEIPDVPSNKFLMRSAKKENDREDGKRDRERPREERNREERHKDRRPGGWDREERGRMRDRPKYTRSGRVIKGRGTFRYQTPSRSRSRSMTPPHWRQAQSRTIKLSDFEKIEEERMKHEEEVKRREIERKKRHALKEIEEGGNVDGSKKGKGDSDVESNAKQSRKSPFSEKEEGECDTTMDASNRPEETSNVLDYNALDYEDQPSDRESKAEPSHKSKKRYNKVGAEHDSENRKESHRSDSRSDKKKGSDKNDDKSDAREVKKPVHKSEFMAMAFGVEPKAPDFPKFEDNYKNSKNQTGKDNKRENGADPKKNDHQHGDKNAKDDKRSKKSEDRHRTSDKRVEKRDSSKTRPESSERKSRKDDREDRAKKVEESRKRDSRRSRSRSPKSRRRSRSRSRGSKRYDRKNYGSSPRRRRSRDDSRDDKRRRRSRSASSSDRDRKKRKSSRNRRSEDRDAKKVGEAKVRNDDFDIARRESVEKEIKKKDAKKESSSRRKRSASSSSSD